MTTVINGADLYPPIPGFAKLWRDRYTAKGGKVEFRWSKLAKAWRMFFPSGHGNDGETIQSGIARIEKEIGTNRVGRR